MSTPPSSAAGSACRGPSARTPAGGMLTFDDLRALVRGRDNSPDELRSVALQLEETWRGATPPEHVRMLIALGRGDQMGGSSGWFGPAASRYSWDWLARFHEIPVDGEIVDADFRGPAAFFRGLDRQGNGRITREDLDWSDDHPYVQQAALVHRFFRRIDLRGDGRITRDEILGFFEKAAEGKDFLLSSDLRRAVLAGAGGFLPGDAPTTQSLVEGLFTGELGSPFEGPELDAEAPDFRLMTHDGRREIHLAEEVGKRPIVLMFGNFTCPPFRSYLPVVEDLHERYAAHAMFLGVYVREAHPTDGWLLESNSRAGVRLTQPRTYAERVEAAGACHEWVRYSMPLLVDEIDDPVGSAYSGMPARMYLIDSGGRIAYKAGRGPFGLKPGEMEQALVMLLLDEAGRAENDGGARG